MKYIMDMVQHNPGEANFETQFELPEKLNPHPNLIFSIKHTALDFWRRVKFNPCITKGQHQQIIEVQCQREYEGKGAYPNYIMDGVLNGFSENRTKIGLVEVAGHPLVQGIYTWTRGGGWFGPYIGNELWCDLHAFVIAGFASKGRKESELLEEFARKRLGLNEGDIGRFIRICRLSGDAVLKGRYCEAFDHSLNESMMPTNIWMRDDRIGVLNQLQEVFGYLVEHGLVEEALNEKREAVTLWSSIRELSLALESGHHEMTGFIKISAEYGYRLFQVISKAWSALLEGYTGERLVGWIGWS